jgi:hypothetical protein
MISKMQRTPSTGLEGPPRHRNRGERETTSVRTASTISPPRRRSSRSMRL